MQIIADTFDILSTMCKAARRPGIYVSFDRNEPWESIIEAAPYLDWPAFKDVKDAGYVFILCDTMSEVDSFFDRTVGAAGPTEANPYDGVAQVYAVTCNSSGTLVNTNA